MSVIDKPVTPVKDPLEEIPVLPAEPHDPVADLLDRALRVMEERGWGRFTLEDSAGRVCAVGALNYVLSGKAHRQIEPRDQRYLLYKRTLERLVSIIQRKHAAYVCGCTSCSTQDKRLPVHTVMNFNDAHDYSKLVKVFEQAKVSP